jgi:predicted permease
MGAGRARLVRQLLIESLLLAAAGSAVGIALAAAGTRLLDVTTHQMLDLPDWMRFDLNPRVLAVAIAAAAGAGLLSGLMPALRASTVAPNDVLRENARGSIGMRRGGLARWLIAGQIGFACCALVMAALFAVSAVHASRSTLGYDPDHLLCGRIELQAPAYDTPADRSRFYERLLERVKALPGVAAAAVSSRDLVANGVYGPFEIEGVNYARPTDKPAALLEVVSREYFDVVRRGAVLGRVFDASDRGDSPPVALVNASFAAQVWPGEDPLGKRIRRSEGGARWATVVGVVPDLNLQGVGNSRNGAGYYLLQDQMGWGWLDLLVRTHGDAAALAPALRIAVAEIDPRLPIHTIGTVTERQARSMAGMTIISSMTTVFALAALLLASVGIYGVTSAMARRRHHEFGMRVALGAGSERILRLMFLGSAPQAAVGILGGIAFGALLVRPLRPMTSADGSDEWMVFVAVAAVLGVTALLSTLLPALRAARADPMAVLRGD